MADDWETYKETIHQLYITDGLPLKSVALRMKESHDFDRNLAQYHHKLKQWGFRKNLKANERELIYQRVAKRNAEDPSTSQVMWNGLPLQSKRLKRLLSRVPVSNPWTRPKISSTPSECGKSLQLVVAMSPREISPLPRKSWFALLPWFKFTRDICLDFVTFQFLNPRQDPWADVSMVPIHELGSFEELTENALPFTSKVSPQLCMMYLIPEEAPKSTAYLQNTIPEEYDGDHNSIITRLRDGSAREFESEALRILLYKLSNKMKASFDARDDLTDAKILEVIKTWAEMNPQWLKSVLASRGSSATAIAESLFAMAIRQSHSEIISSILETQLVSPNDPIFAALKEWNYIYRRGFVPTTLVWVPPSSFCTPLQLAVSTGNWALMETLIEYGAEVDIEKDSQSLSPLELACSLGSFTTAEVMVKTLLARGAVVNRPKLETRPTVLMIAVATANIQLIPLLVKHGAEVERTWTPGSTGAY
ncbi:Clr5 domain-containing protein [Xylariaceae sp. FL1272]|nr:Clr5 domain-containing protein [Xylariaceae sp. FL1272]